MIANTEVVTQDMVMPSQAAPGKVLVKYPRGGATILTIDNSGTASLRALTDPAGYDGAWQQATVLPNGNLLYCSDTPNSLPTLVLGAGLHPL